ncbi:MAG TPA: DNA polymerase domain-containing protein [Candidatus Thermoplasmatota archaeon]|nr:DNA polymerase domain-containing protein [Candidatus Thermoplasmatota archaeon]
MDVPLAVFRSIQNDRQYLDIWTSAGMQRVPAPFHPYAYSKRPRELRAEKAEKVLVRPLSRLAPEEWWRYEFSTVRGVTDMSKDERPLEMADNHVAFVERVLIDEPEYFRQFKHGRAPRLMVIDLEQLTTGSGFPTERDPLIAIGYGCDDAEPVVFLGDGRSDKDICEKFLQAMEECDPDVLVGYNIGGYDLPMLIKRIRANGLDARRLGRGQRGPIEQDDEIVLDGRLTYDVFDSIKLDQTLHGIKDLKLKTVGAWMKLPVIKEDMSDTRALVGTERLADYNRNDIKLTRSLAKIYWKNFVALAELYGAPLNVILRSTSIFHTNVLQGRVFSQVQPRVVSDGTNEERYRDLFGQTGGVAFVGGIVEIYQRGLFEPMWKVDFSSMYPSIMVSLGSGADNTRFLGTEALTKTLVSRRDGERRVYSIPDESRGVNLIVEIDGISPMALEVRRLLKLRGEIKKRAKEAADPGERERLGAQQNVIKVILNSIYGNMASPFSRYGSLPVGVAIVGVARTLIRRVEDAMGDSKVETDTDGIYASKAPEIETLNKVVDDFVRTELGGENFMRLEQDSYKAGYFHERKSYLLLHHDGRIEKHGVAFKASSACGVFDKTLNAVSESLLMRKGDPKEIGRKAFDMAQYGREDFVMRVRMGKALADYAAENAVGAQVARKYQEMYGREIKKGEQLEYVKTSQGYEPPTDDAFKRLDKDYYKGLVETVLDRLAIDWRPTRQVRLFDFG